MVRPSRKPHDHRRSYQPTKTTTMNTRREECLKKLVEANILIGTGSNNRAGLREYALVSRTKYLPIYLESELMIKAIERNMKTPVEEAARLITRTNKGSLKYEILKYILEGGSFETEKE